MNILANKKISIFMVFHALFFLHFSSVNGQNITFNNNDINQSEGLFNPSKKCIWHENVPKKKHCTVRYVCIWFIEGGLTIATIAGVGYVFDGGGNVRGPLTKSQEEFDFVGIGGIGVFLLGAGIAYINHKYEVNHWQKFSLTGAGNQVGVAYNFR